MDNDFNTTTKKVKRTSLIDRMGLFIMGKGKEVPVETNKRPLVDRLNSKIQPLQEKYDKWFDDLEEEIINEKKEQRSIK